MPLIQTNFRLRGQINTWDIYMWFPAIGLWINQEFGLSILEKAGPTCMYNWMRSHGQKMFERNATQVICNIPRIYFGVFESHASRKLWNQQDSRCALYGWTLKVDKKAITWNPILYIVSTMRPVRCFCNLLSACLVCKKQKKLWVLMPSPDGSKKTSCQMRKSLPQPNFPSFQHQTPQENPVSLLCMLMCCCSEQKWKDICWNR